MSKKTFILSDQTVNQFGFIVLTAGINLERFKKNPVMLAEHKLGLTDVAGAWEDVRVDGLKLVAEPDFDLEDVAVKEIARKVDKGFIKGASVWVDFKAEDVKLDVKGYEGIPVVTKSELMEASIVSVPNNKNAIKLSADGTMLEDKSLALKLSTNQQTDIKQMKDLALIFAALGLQLTATSTDAHAVEAINALKAERDANKLKLAEAETKLTAEHDLKVNALIDGAITSKKLTADKKDHYVKLAKLDFDSTKSIIDGMTAHTTLSSQLGAAKEGDEAKSEFEGKTFKELMQIPGGGKFLAKLKAENKDAHKKLWIASYPEGKYND